MRTLTWMLIGLFVAWMPAAASSGETDVRDSLHRQSVHLVRINLNPWGPHLGFETEIAGNDVRLDSLIALVRGAKPGGGHRCANAGAIRFLMKDGRLVGVGLLPSHTAGRYELRLYDGDAYVAAYSVDRGALLAVLENLGLPMEDPAFRE